VRLHRGGPARVGGALRVARRERHRDRQRPGAGGRRHPQLGARRVGRDRRPAPARCRSGGRGGQHPQPLRPHLRQRGLPGGVRRHRDPRARERRRGHRGVRRAGPGLLPRRPRRPAPRGGARHAAGPGRPHLLLRGLPRPRGPGRGAGPPRPRSHRRRPRGARPRRRRRARRRPGRGVRRAGVRHRLLPARLAAQHGRRARADDRRQHRGARARGPRRPRVRRGAAQRPRADGRRHPPPRRLRRAARGGAHGRRVPLPRRRPGRGLTPWLRAAATRSPAAPPRL
ncbi:MAG: MBL-fold metallo-hydrolase superfamily, partial [uncultured Nocardioides sp.]